MLESVLADILTRVLGQYLQGIDRQKVQFGAWSGLVELRSVALRPEALAVLFETLGLALPVTVESGFIGLLRLIVPWKSIGSSPIQIYMQNVTIVARPVNGDGSTDSQLQLRDRRINRAKLNTDDAVREASWNVANERDQSNEQSWSSWLVSDQLRATIINNIQVHLNDIIIRFEDPYSNPKTPYVASIECQSIDIISTNAKWEEAFIEDFNQKLTRKLLQIKGFNANWSPLSSSDFLFSPSPPSPTSSTSSSSSPSLSEHPKNQHFNIAFNSPETLREYVSSSRLDNTANAPPTAPRSLIHRIDGSVRLRLSADGPIISDVDFRLQQPSADIDIILPEILKIDLNDVQYTSLMQTSLYFARLTTRGFRPSTAKARWKWAVDQLLPGCSARFARALRFSPKGLAETRQKRDSYIAYRTSLLKARRTAVDEPKQINEQLEQMEDSTEFHEIVAYRDAVDAGIEKDGHLWIPVTKTRPAESSSQAESEGTTMSSFWSMLGYDSKPSSSQAGGGKANISPKDEPDDSLESAHISTPSSLPRKTDGNHLRPATTMLNLRAAFLLRGVVVRLSQGGYPDVPIRRVELKLTNFRVGILYSSAKDMIVEAVLGSIEAWDIQNKSRMVYSRSAFTNKLYADQLVHSEIENLYPRDVCKAIESIRNGINPAKELLENEVSDTKHTNGEFFDELEETQQPYYYQESNAPERLPFRLRDGQHDPENSSRPKFRITEEEFFATAANSSSCEYVAAISYSNIEVTKETANKKIASLDISIATLEAVVDGPTGSLAWGLKFWQPKGLVQDPIMSFLGAAAGARIAQLRIELGQAIFADSLPLKVNAVILAPRFIIRSSSLNSPVIVVNMGTLGVCTSDTSLQSQDQNPQDTAIKHIRYSSYVLTLDDLGVYFSPNHCIAQSHEPESKLNRDVNKDSSASNVDSFLSHPPTSIHGVERIIRPFSLRFVLQILQDSKVAQVAHSASQGHVGPETEEVAKLRLRGKIPQLSLILTQKSFQHIVVAARDWSDEIKSSQLQQSMYDKSFSSNMEQPVPGDVFVHVRDDEASTQIVQNSPTFASYNVKVNIQTMSLELRESTEVPLVCAIASDLSSNIVKRGKSSLSGDIALRSWSVTDGSRGSTAPFRHLLYSGTMSASQGVSPPHNSFLNESSHASVTTGTENFVTIRYSLDVQTREQSLYVHFLSLHLNCVRETYLKLLSFFDGVRKYISQQRLHGSRNSVTEAENSLSDGPSILQAPNSTTLDEPSTAEWEAVSLGKAAVRSEFDGFTLTLIASEGVVATFEMKKSGVKFLREHDGSKKAWGSFGSILLRDLTAPLQEHISVIDYEGSIRYSADVEDSQHEMTDGWELSFPANDSDGYEMKASFDGIRILYLQRFLDVIEKYFSVLVSRARLVVSSFVEDAKVEFPETERLVVEGTASSIPSKFFTSLSLKNLSLRIPRHSTCISESVTFKIAQVQVDNKIIEKDSTWNVFFENMQGAVQYVSDDNEGEDSDLNVSSVFLEECSAELRIHSSQNFESVSEKENRPELKVTKVLFNGPLCLNLCEAQYTVLYFVFTENFGESDSSSGLSSLQDISESFEEALQKPKVSTPKESHHNFSNGAIDIDQDMSILYPNSNAKTPSTSSRIEVKLPVLSCEVSRGWDVSQDSCKILGVYLTELSVNVNLSTPNRKVVELGGILHSIIDLREESQPKKRNMVVHLASPLQEDGEHASPLENVSLVYEKVSDNRPSIFVSLEKLQLEIVPELLRDLTYLAVPGWPYLKSSMFGPDSQYVGRTVNLELNESQVLLLSESSDLDRRALVLTGKFQIKVDWKRTTGAKTIVLRTEALEVFKVNEVLSLKKTGIEFAYGLKDVCALPFQKSHSPLIYPTDAMVEFIDPNVDDAGRRVSISVDAALCMLCISEIPVLRAITSRLSSLRSSYLAERDWIQPIAAPGSQPEESLDPKVEQKRKAQDNLNLTMTIPVSRYVITDDRQGRFVPILEGRLTSLLVQAHSSSMVQFEGELSMDLFNPTKGCWEPSLEPWKLSASMSRGQSGTRAFVLKSDERLNLNIAPTSITAAKTVASALRTVTENFKPSEDSLELSLQKSRREESTDSASAPRPSVAVFMVQNQLGVQISMRLPGKKNWTSIPHESKVEVGAQSEALISSGIDQEKISREEALRCSILIPTFAPQELSASEPGKHSVVCYPLPSLTVSQQELSNFEADVSPIEILWDVELLNGVPTCTVRSAFRLTNDTKGKVDVLILLPNEEKGKESINELEGTAILEPNEVFHIPIHDLDKQIYIRPVIPSQIPSKTESVKEIRPFQWSSPFPRLKLLLDSVRKGLNGGQSTSSNSRKPQNKGSLLECKPNHSSSQGYFFKLASTSPKSFKTGLRSAWLDVSIRAPLMLTNMLPGPISYQVRSIEGVPSNPSVISDSSDGKVIATGVVNALESINLHFSDESLNTKFLSTAFDNGAQSSEDNLSVSNLQIPHDFGPSIPIGSIISGKSKHIYPSPVQSEDLQGQVRKHFRANVQLQKEKVTNMIVHAGFWVRNRSDTPVEICSRPSFYSAGSIAFYLRERAPYVEPKSYVCFEGPFLSIRLPSNRETGQETGQSNWWTSPSALDDIEKPISISISGRSLELEVRNSVGLDCNTYVVTIRNSSWIINSTSSTLQWCQQSSLDPHGNCPTRLLNSLGAGEVQGLHWKSKTSIRAIHLRLAEQNGHSEWIWSPAIPLDIGHSRELPAKMYRPRTHDQYIARVASKEIAGYSRALVVYEEDRENPPYRITNMCKERAIAFSQTDSQERPWLVRAGKSTRYSWDDPLAPPKSRELNIRIIEKEDLDFKLTANNETSQRSRTWRAPTSVLNIDKVGDRVKVLGDPFDPPVVFNVSVDGATKVVTLFDEDKENANTSSSQKGKSSSSERTEKETVVNSELDADVVVPVLGWDDISGNPILSRNPEKYAIVDYPLRPILKEHNQLEKSTTVRTDAAIFLNSIGLSIIDGEPEELLYFSSTGILVNFESSADEQNIMMSVEKIQVDNQMTRTHYPVLLWTKPSSVEEADQSDQIALQNSIVIELHRDLTKDDILMVKSFQAQVRHFNISFEEELVSRLLKFFNDFTIGSKFKHREKLLGIDAEGLMFMSLLPGASEGSIRQQGNTSSSQRIYVHHFKIGSSGIRLTSTGSGSTIGKAAGLNASTRAIVGLLLNVENCKFELPALIVNNVFDSLHHFGILIKTYYIQQLDNQRIKLLTSNSLVGNPAALFDAVGTGAKDFLSEPGRAKGSADFLASVGRGSKSLFAHTVGGFVGSVSSIPRAVSTGLERAVGDNNYIAERERIRGSALASGNHGTTKNSAQGLATGAMSLAHGISSGVTGFIREPLQGAKQGGAGGLLKGIGKAFIGGVAKPVAGAMDFVAEPAAGLSRQIADDEITTGSTPTFPDRPPRAFHGKSRRVECFDRSFSVGVWLLKAVCMYSSIAVRSDLVDWIEMSDREDRKSIDADLWVWNIVQRFSRCMPKTKKQLRAEARQSQGLGSDGLPRSRPEKTRVALLTNEEILIASLDCKLIDIIPIWNDAGYEIIPDGKELIIRATVFKGEIDISTGSLYSGTSSLITGAQSLIQAPWDVSNSGQRRKPAVGQSCIDRIGCSSVEARNDLQQALIRIVNEKEELRKKQQSNKLALEDPMASGQELASSSQWRSYGGQDMKPPPGDEKRGSSFFGANEPHLRGDRLNRVVEELCSNASLDDRKQGLWKVSESGIRMVLVNQIDEANVELRLKDGSLEHGRWVVEAPLAVTSFDAQPIGVDKDSDNQTSETELIVNGKITYAIVKAVAGEQDKELGQVEFEFYRDIDSDASFISKPPNGFSIKCERGTILVVRVRRETLRASSAEGTDNTSNDEKLLGQLTELGFKFEDAIEALANAGGDLVKAVDILTSLPMP